MLSSDLETLWTVHADIDAIVAKKRARNSKADWLVVFEWDVPGALPDPDELPLLTSEAFERTFLMQTAYPGYLVEWDGRNRQWVVPAEALPPLESSWDFVCDVAERWITERASISV